jgi:hypothetical protein
MVVESEHDCVVEIVAAAVVAVACDDSSWRGEDVEDACLRFNLDGWKEGLVSDSFMLSYYELSKSCTKSLKQERDN